MQVARLQAFADVPFCGPCAVCCTGDGKCVVCDSYVKPHTLVRVCDECNYGSYEGRCVICGGVGISDAHYCKECTVQEKDVRTVTIYVFCCVQISFDCASCSVMDAQKL
jgi:hypothetical protein